MKNIKIPLIILLILMALVASVVYLSLWANKPSTMIVGEWKQVGTGDILTFYNEGTFTETDAQFPVSGSYKFIDANKIKADYDGVGKLFSVSPVVMDIQINKDHLVITSPFSARQEYDKVPDSTFDDSIRSLFYGGSQGGIRILK